MFNFQIEKIFVIKVSSLGSIDTAWNRRGGQRSDGREAKGAFRPKSAKAPGKRLLAVRAIRRLCLLGVLSELGLIQMVDSVMTAETMRQARAPTQKFLKRQETVVLAASRILNQKGLKGMTLGDIGEQLSMAPTGVAYYFANKEELAAACYHRTIQTIVRFIAEAATEPTVTARIKRLIHLILGFRKDVASGEVSPLAQADDIRALGDPQVLNAYVNMFRQARALFTPPGRNPASRSITHARVHFLIQQFWWMDIWVPHYQPEDFERVTDRYADIILNGIATLAQRWAPEQLILPEFNIGGREEPREVFLRAATQLINEQGYHGASVERISARLDVTKGAFYHHIDTKDDLVVICFGRTTEVIRRTQAAAQRLPTDGHGRLVSALNSLIEHQLLGDAPLLRGATASLPAGIRQDILNDYERNSVRFGSMISDGQADGSLRLVDVQIAAQVTAAVVNGMGELPFWLPDPTEDRVGENYLRPLFDGLVAGLD